MNIKNSLNTLNRIILSTKYKRFKDLENKSLKEITADEIDEWFKLSKLFHDKSPQGNSII